MKITGFIILIFALCAQIGFAQEKESSEKKQLWSEISPYFSPEKEFQDQFGDYRSVLRFYDGREVKTAADWKLRRAEILNKWQQMMGPWPKMITDQRLTLVDSVQKEGYMQYKVTFDWLPETQTDGYLLVPDGAAGKKLPAVITVFYEPETAIGEGKAERDFARGLTKRGFVTLSIGTRKASKDRVYSLYYPSMENATVQPLSALAYAAGNAWYALSKEVSVDSSKIGIMGHSFGGKWAMFGSALFEKFACAVWSDPGIVFDETKGAGVNYWEPWYLGYYNPPWENTWRKTGMIKGAKGLYPELMKNKIDLHELHALMAPRPFLVSGGSSDPKYRWVALNHTIRLNEFLGYNNRVAMTNRPEHSPDNISNNQAYSFFEYFLK